MVLGLFKSQFFKFVHLLTFEWEIKLFGMRFNMNRAHHALSSRVRRMMILTNTFSLADKKTEEKPEIAIFTQFLFLQN